MLSRPSAGDNAAGPSAPLYPALCGAPAPDKNPAYVLRSNASM